MKQLIVIDNDIDSWVETLISQCLEFYHKAAEAVDIVLVKNKIPDDGKIGLAIEDIDGFVLYWTAFEKIAESHALSGVNPNATLTHLIVDTCFHEMHHCQSYKEDSRWAFSHRGEEEAMANETASDLCVDFFKTVNINVPIGNIPYWFKTNNTVLTDIREYFNILLDSKNEWGPLEKNVIKIKEIPLSPTTTIPETTPTNTGNILDPLAGIPTTITTEASAAQSTIANYAITLYNTCFDKIFLGCVPNENGFTAPENIFELISVPPIVDTAVMMAPNGSIINQKIKTTMSGTIFKTSKLPAYDFVLFDGKKRRIVPQNPLKRNNTGAFTATALRAQAGEKIGYVIDATSNQFLLRYENGTLTPY